MKKEVVLFSVLFLILIAAFSGVTAQEEIDRAYDCLNNTITSKTCSALSINEKVFSVLATGQCKEELISQAKPSGCYGEGSTCNIELTAKAGLALAEASENNTLQQEWLLNQRGVSKELIWYLEIDGDQEMTCEIISNKGSSQISIGEDKKISVEPHDLNKCFTITPSKYWLEIDESCYEEKFAIKCDGTYFEADRNFLTTLLFKEKTSPTIHVSKKVDKARIKGTSYQQINSFCFQGTRGECDYPGSLWASFFLDFKIKGIADNIKPYLITGAENHFRDFPSTFLYSLTNNLNYQADILSFQSSEGSWSWGNDKYYGTAIALFAFMGEEGYFKENARGWLLSPEVQQPDGCWDRGDILNNAFLLYTLWPRNHPIPEVNNCTAEGAGYSCCDPSIENCVGDINSTLSCLGNDFCFYEEPNPCLEIENNYTCVANELSCNEGLGEIIQSLDCTGDNLCCDPDWTEGPKYCESEGFKCVEGNSSCIGGKILDDFECGLGTEVCCGPSPPEEKLCEGFEGYGCIVEGGSCAGGITNLLECSSGYECCKEEISEPGDSCVDDGNTCTRNIACATEGLAGYSCPTPTVCCDSLIPEPTCYDQNGIICDTNNEFCKSGIRLDTFELKQNEVCCLSGTCEEKEDITPSESECEVQGGSCYSSCTDNEEETSNSCSDNSDVCCVVLNTKTGSYWWVWALFLAIILVTVGILYRDKIQEFIQKMQSKKSGGGKGPREPPLRRRPLRMPQNYERKPQMTPAPRKIIPRSRPIQRNPPIRKKSPAELDAVLKKLKEIGK